MFQDDIANLDNKTMTTIINLKNSIIKNLRKTRVYLLLNFNYSKDF